MDERVRTVLQAMARGLLGSDDRADYHYCLYCTISGYWEENEEPAHDPPCPISLARLLLREAGEPLRLYRVRVAQFLHPTQTWHWMEWYVKAFSEAEALEELKDYTDPARWRNGACEDMAIL